jgi:hypothetical protein
MSYKPNFCCQCGEKIERVDWFLKSRRFCELCATEHGIHDKIPWLLVAAGVLFGVFGIGAYLRTPERTLNLSPNNLVVQNANKNETNRNVISQQTQIQADNSALTKTDVLPAKDPKPKKDETTEAVYYCGAPTKKGTPCSRRVKGGGRCWQHAGQTAMLAQEKLRVAN